MFFASGCSHQKSKNKFAHIVEHKKTIFHNWHFDLKGDRFDNYHSFESALPGTNFNGDTVCAGSSGSLFYCFNSLYGRKLWQFQAEGSISSEASFFENMVYFGDDKGYLYAMDYSSGQELWRYSSGGEITRKPVIKNGTLYFANQVGKIVALEADSGKWLWHYQAPSVNKMTIYGYAQLTFYENYIYAGFSQGMLCKLDASDGSLVWKKALPGEGRFRDIDIKPKIYDAHLFVSVHSLGIYRISHKDGEVKETFPFKGITAFTIDRGWLYLGNSDGQVKTVDIDSRRPQWVFKLNQGTINSLQIYNNILLAGTSENGLFLLDKEYGTFMDRFYTGSGIYGSTVNKHQIYLISNQGILYSLRLDSPYGRLQK